METLMGFEKFTWKQILDSTVPKGPNYSAVAAYKTLSFYWTATAALLWKICAQVDNFR